MVGKTFKGLTDELLRWQTAEFPEHESHRTASTVFVRPDIVVEIAIDGVQRSPRYPGGIALRFARVKGYRPDKTAAEADTIQTLRSLLRGRPEGAAVQAEGARPRSSSRTVPWNDHGKLIHRSVSFQAKSGWMIVEGLV